MPNAIVKIAGLDGAAAKAAHAYTDGASANGTANPAYNENSIALPSDRGTLEVSGANLMYEGARVKSWMLGRDVNPAGRGDGAYYSQGAFRVGSVRPSPTTTPVGGWGNSVNNGCGGCGFNFGPPFGPWNDPPIVPPQLPERIPPGGFDPRVPSGGDFPVTPPKPPPSDDPSSSPGGTPPPGGWASPPTMQYCQEFLESAAVLCLVICIEWGCDFRNIDAGDCCDEFDSLGAMSKYFSRCWICPKEIKDAVAWCWALRCGWDDAECCAIRTSPVNPLTSNISCIPHPHGFDECRAKCSYKIRTIGKKRRCIDFPPGTLLVYPGYSTDRIIDLSCGNWFDPSQYISSEECEKRCGSPISYFKKQNPGLFGREVCQ